MRRTHFIVALTAAVVVLGVACGAVLLTRPGALPSTITITAPAAIGGPFQLVDVDGRPVTEQSLRGKPTAMFFGFTQCPEICPTTLAEMTAALQALGERGDRLNVVFVSVDPERDTPALMKTYLTSFDPRIQGFTGTPAQVEAAARAYRVYHAKVPLDGGGYTVDHTSAIYLFDKDGRFVEPIGYGSPHERVVAQLSRLVG